MSVAADSVAWPLLAAAVAALGGLRAGRRRSALNQALHEVRRPLQALALAGVREVDGSVRLAAAALERLDREINGGAPRERREVVRVRRLLIDAVGRWQARAQRCEASLRLRDDSGGVEVEIDAAAVAQALDNLIVNAIEHGGRRILVEARTGRRSIRIAVLDSGRSPGPRRRGRPGEGALAAVTGRRRHGHGLQVVRRVAAAHGGRFSLRQRPQGSAAVIELPLRPLGAGRTA